MRQEDIFREIEQMFRSYHDWQLKLAVLHQRNTFPNGFISLTHDKSFSNSAVERLAIERAEIAQKVKLVQLCMKAMTRDERTFIELRYFSGFTMDLVEANMRGWSRRQLYRLRTSILAKAAWLLGFVVAA